MWPGGGTRNLRRMRNRPILALCAACALSACAGGQDDYPRLLPTEQVLAEPALPAHAATVAADAPPEAAVVARAEALRARADALRGPVIEPGTRARMTPAAETGPGG